jgi:hypothetical protein
MTRQDHISCPSNRCKPGSELIGVRQDDGTIAILPQPLPVDQHFVDVASRDPIAPEERFRFSNKCVEGGCHQWTGSHCGVIDRMLQTMEASLPTKVLPTASEAQLPTCGIRPTCRWYRQSGHHACRVCPYILTHVTAADTPAPLNI